MLSIRATYENGRLKLLDPVNIKEDTDVIVTFLDDDFQISMDSSLSTGDDSTISEASLNEDQPEEYYTKLRAHKRFPA